MRSLYRFAKLSVFALIVAAAVSCSADRAPTAAPNPSLLGDLTSPITGTLGSLGLLRCDVPRTNSSTATIGAAGGEIHVGRHTLFIPPKALASPVKITATAPAGEYVRVNFEPEGLRFARPTMLSMSYADCSVLKPLKLKVVYVGDQLNILEVLPSVADLLSQTVRARLEHFSGYMLAD